MSTDFSTHCEQALRASATMLDNLASIATTLNDVQAETAKLPFFVRGFVSSEVKRGTGQDLPGWVQTVGALTAAIQGARAAVERAQAAGTVAGSAAAPDRAAMNQTAARLEAERPRLEAMVTYMSGAPAKIKTVPAGMIPAERRDDLLGAIDRQTQALRGALAALPELAQSLTALGAA